DVAEYRRPRLKTGAALDLLLQRMADPPESRMAELVHLPGLERHGSLLGYRSFRRDQDREIASAGVTASDQLAGLLDVKRLLGDQDHVRSAGDAGVQGDPPRLTSHDLDHEDAVVTLRGRVQAVDRVSGDLKRCVEPEGEIRPPEVVVDRLGHAHDGDPLSVEPVRHPERVLSPDRDQAVDAVAPEGLGDRFRSPLAAVAVGPRTAENRFPARKDSTGRLDRQLLRGVLEHAPPPVSEA